MLLLQKHAVEVQVGVPGAMLLLQKHAVEVQVGVPGAMLLLQKHAGKVWLACHASACRSMPDETTIRRMLEGQPHRKLCKRWDRDGDAHCLTFSCFRRQPLLSRPRSCQWFLDALDSARRRQPFDLWAWVIMPEHIHLLLWPREGTAISSILRSLKLPVARRAILWTQEHAPEFLDRMCDRRSDGTPAYRFWQRGGGYDRNLRNARDVHEKIQYLHNNPLRRKLVERVEDWPWSSWHVHQNGGSFPIGLDLDSIPVMLS